MLKIPASSLSIIIGKNPYSCRLNIIKRLLQSELKTLNPKSKVEHDKEVNVSKANNNMINGIKKEKGILLEWCKNYNMVLEDKNEKNKLKHIELFSLDNKWVLSGKCDGLLNNGDVIEIKNRVSGIPNNTPIQDYIQIQAYLQLYDSYVCHYVQNYDDVMDYKIVERNDEYWNKEIFPKIYEFALFYETCKKDEKALDVLLYLGNIKQ